MMDRLFDNENEAIEAMRADGIIYDVPFLEPTGSPRRYGTDTKPRGKDATVFIHADGKGGFYQNHTTDTDPVKFQIRHEYTEQEKREFAKKQAEREEQADKLTRIATRKLTYLWRKKSQPAHVGFPYLVAKGIKPYTARFAPAYESASPRLLIPGYSVKSGELQTLQSIVANPGAPKIFFKNAKKKGAYCPIGKMTDENILCLVEGFATGASVHEATGFPVAVAFDSGNLKHVARAFRERFPDILLLICGDDDLDRELKEGHNPGKSAATVAAEMVDGITAFPFVSIDRPDHVSDFNDMHKHYGLDHVRDYIQSVITDEVSQQSNKETINDE